ncbi:MULTISPECIES: acid phosphatase [unclassified Inquilinus]|uniref:acid phosphatase n=1 Tax=unclassified Inquilinus TaxID=2645927 RepID=UPI003F920180
MNRLIVSAVAAGAAGLLAPPGFAADPGQGAGLHAIDTVVVLYAENRSFDNLYGTFPGAEGLANATDASKVQLDRDGTPLKELPPVWDGLTAKGVTPPVTQAQTEHLPDGPFDMDDPQGLNVSLNTVTHDLWHRFYQNQMQINGGRNDKFVAYADAGAEVMGHLDGSKTAMWKIAQQYTLADHFFMGVFGGSFMNHIWLACACVARYPDADKSAAKPSIAVVDPDGVTLTQAPNSPKSAMDGIPKFVADGNLTPDFYAVNTMQPPYQPSANKPAAGGDTAYADPMAPTTLPPQTQTTIGDLLSAKGVSWAWYSGAWQSVLDHGNATPVPAFQYHHQPYNYFITFAPGTASRTEHLRDGGLDGAELVKAIDAGTLPQVTFYKPQGNLNEHAGYADVTSGDQHLAMLIDHLQKSPQWPHMLVVVTYDENGGFWDHVAPPKGDRWGPSMRVPAIIISPFAKKGFVDHTPYDTTSILRFITRRFELPVLPGIAARDAGIAANGNPPLGDLTAALDFATN